jgi:hypothetical protein
MASINQCEFHFFIKSLMNFQWNWFDWHDSILKSFFRTDS